MTFTFIGELIVGTAIAAVWAAVIWLVETHAREKDKIARAQRDVQRAALKAQVVRTGRVDARV